MAEIQNFIDVQNLTYCGKEANEIFSKMIYALDIASTGIQMMDNVKGKRKLYTGEMKDVWQKYSCPFTPSGEVSLAEDFIEPAAIKVDLENCYDAFWDTYFVEQTQITLNGGIPQSFSDWFFDRLQKQMAKEYQEIFWKGDTDYSQETKKFLAVTDGIEKKLNAEATTIDGAKFTVANILSQVEAAILKAQENAADQEVDIEGYKVFINKNDLFTLLAALGQNSNSPLTNQVWANFTKVGDKVYAYGLEVVPTEQSRNSVIVGPARNMVLGYDTFSSHTEYKLLDMRNTTGDNMFRIKAISNIAVGLVLGELFVYSRPNA